MKHALQAALAPIALSLTLSACSGRDAASADASQLSGNLVLDTRYGKVSGDRDTRTEGVLAFKGIPYAQPPVGSLRWKAPEPPSSWPGVRAAKDFPAPCLQINRMQGNPQGELEGSEDCLYLNVWTKNPRPSAPRPVMFFLHGGGNLSGSTSEILGHVPLYDGARLAESEDAVVVTVQYRLNVFGFFAHPKLADEASYHASGNYGLLDQLAALRWVKENIRAFGGDPDHVLLFGESAGGTDVCALVASPLGRGLFSSAIIQSGGCENRSTLAAGWYRTFVEQSGCAEGDLGCLRSLDGPSAVRVAVSSATGAGLVQTPAGPIVDGYVLPDTPYVLMQQGRHNHVPLVIGANLDETRGPLFQVPPFMTPETYFEALRRIAGADADRVRMAYPLAWFASPRDAWIAVTTDMQFICPARRVARAVAPHQTEPVYRYLFSQVMAGSPTAASLGASHGLELFYVFQWPGEIPNYHADAADLRLAKWMGGYWSRMAQSGDPNGNGAPLWPRFEPAADTFLELGTPTQAGAGTFPLRCDLWDAITER